MALAKEQTRDPRDCTISIIQDSPIPAATQLSELETSIAGSRGLPAPPAEHPGWDAVVPYLGDRFTERGVPATLYSVLATYPPVRPLCTNPKRYSDNESFRCNCPMHIDSLLVQLTGTEAPQPCKCCAAGNAHFRGCVVPPSSAIERLPRLACANCIGLGWASKCEYAPTCQKAPRYTDSLYENYGNALIAAQGYLEQEVAVTPRATHPVEKANSHTSRQLSRNLSHSLPQIHARSTLDSAARRPQESLGGIPMLVYSRAALISEDEPVQGPKGMMAASSVTLPPAKQTQHAGENLLTLRVEQLRNMNAVQVAQIQMEMAIWEVAFCVVDAESQNIDIRRITKIRSSIDRQLRNADAEEVDEIGGGTRWKSTMAL